MAALCLAASFTLAGCQNPGVIQIAPDKFSVTKSSAAGAFANTSKLKADTINAANKFAADKGLVAVPIAMNESRPPVGFPSCEYVFSLMSQASYQKMRRAEARDWASLSPAQRMQYTLTMQEMEQRDRAASAVVQSQQAATQASIINSALDRGAYIQRTQAFSQPTTVNVQGHVTTSQTPSFIQPVR